MHSPNAEPSAHIAKRVRHARSVQYKRYGKAMTNSQMGVLHIKKFCVLSNECNGLLQKAADYYNLSGRSIHRVLKVARTIADLTGEEHITLSCVAEALQYKHHAGLT